MRIDDDQAVGGHDQRVAVGVRMGGHLARDIAVSAGAVLDEERLAHRLGETLCQHPRGDVGRPARRDRHQHLDRPGRILLRRGGREPRQHQRQRSETDHLELHVRPPRMRRD